VFDFKMLLLLTIGKVVTPSVLGMTGEAQ
jgi:hypothetical protein